MEILTSLVNGCIVLAGVEKKFTRKEKKSTKETTKSVILGKYEDPFHQNAIINIRPNHGCH